MSGGVDSAVAAALLLREGWNVIGATLRLFCHRGPSEERACCSADSVRHAVLDFTDLFRRAVVEPFIDEYRAGRTPNPCVACNRSVKFDPLLEWGRGLGAECVATGHHARLRFASDGRARLLRGADPDKDQSYALWPIAAGTLRHVRFPVGEIDKARVRQIASELGLESARRAESQDICFAAPGEYPALIEERDPEDPSLRPGPIEDESGVVLGRHQGIARYTIGQRKGLGISAPRPLYVLQLDLARRAVVVGPQESLFRRSLVADCVNCLAPLEPGVPYRVEAKIRYRQASAPATAILHVDGTMRVEFDEPRSAIAPGQSVVLYRGDEVLAGGAIRESLP